jgi:target of rapamycin complex 2 subunit MAPKAP1
LDKALYILKVHGTQTVAPSDRTVEALGEKLHLDLVRRRFIGAGIGGGDGVLFGLGLSGSPGSSSPNAPLELHPPLGSTPGSGGGKKRGTAKTSAPGGIQKFDASALTSTTFNTLLATGGDFGGKKYSVLRKQPLSFAPSHPRTLIITPEYLQILPAAPDSLAAPSGKVTNVPMTSIIGVKVSRKHPKMVRVLVYREKETKRYDFEASSRDEASAIMVDVRRGIEGVVGEGAGVY